MFKSISSYRSEVTVQWLYQSAGTLTLLLHLEELFVPRLIYIDLLLLIEELFVINQDLSFMASNLNSLLLSGIQIYYCFFRTVLLNLVYRSTVVSEFTLLLD
jgi:hypothetical protein